MKWLLLSHAQAPLYSTPDALTVVSQVVDEVASGEFPTNEDFRQRLRQLGFVNLWFFLKFVAGYNGPFDKLNTDLHLDMCNVRTRFQRPGARFAAFEPRKVFKSTIFTAGAPAWSALRNPDRTHGIFSNTVDFSLDQVHIIQRIFDSNEFFAWLYPEYVPARNQQRWNNVEGNLPNKTRHTVDPTFAAYGVLCNTAGKHPDDMYIDDPVGDKQLSAMRESGMEMMKIGNWLKSNIRSLTKSADASVYYCGTRYAQDDAHQFVLDSVRECLGYWDEIESSTYTLTEKGEWSVYYRTVKEHGKIIMPEAYTQDLLDLTLASDPWTYYTQMCNNPQKSGIAELNMYTVPECDLVWDAQNRPAFKIVHSTEHGDPDIEYVLLSSCDLVQAGDPATTDKGITAKTSRSACGLIAHDPKDRQFVFGIKADYIKPSVFFDWYWSNAKRYASALRCSLLEAQGPFKILAHDFVDEEYRRNKNALLKHEPQVFLKLKAVTKTGNKDVSIRNAIEPRLNAGKLYVEKASRTEFLSELNVFPASNRKDILDMVSLGVMSTVRPYDKEEIQVREEAENRFRNRAVSGCASW
jgi:hypothetical protein